jgi:hypothetical protein
VLGFGVVINNEYDFHTSALPRFCVEKGAVGGEKSPKIKLIQKSVKLD